MSAFEYKIVPAPTKGVKLKGLRSTQDRFAHALEQALNDLGAKGWEFQRSESLPCEEREGLMGKTTQFQHMLVFRRPIKTAEQQPAPPLLEDHRADAPDQAADTPSDKPTADSPAVVPAQVPQPQPQPQPKVAAE